MTPARRVLDIDALEATLADTGVANLPAGDWICSRAIRLPTDRGCLLSGDGPCITRLWFGGTDGIVSEIRATAYACATVRGMSIFGGKNAGDGVRIIHDWKIAMHDPQLILRDLHIAPAPSSEGTGGWARHIALDGVWGPKIQNCHLVGMFNGVDKPSLLASPSATGIELGGCQEAKITDCYIAGVRTGVHIRVAAPGQGEGLGIDKTTVINCLTCIRLEGKPAGFTGAFPTPTTFISNCHLFYLDYAIFATNRYDVVIHANSLCGSHLIEDKGFAILIAGHCSNVRIVGGNNFWTTSGREVYGVIVDASTDGIVAGNTFHASMKLGVLLTPANAPVSGWYVGGNVNRCKWPVQDCGTDNTVG